MTAEVSNVISKLNFFQQAKLPLILQSEATECGLACLAMVANFHGKNFDLPSIRRKFVLSLQGLTLMDIMNFAEHLDLTSRPLRVELDELRGLQTPCILHWDMNHFVVLKSVSRKQITIYDPAVGERKIDFSHASQYFTGIALELTPTQEFKQEKAAPKLKFSDFWSHISGLKSSLFLVFSLSILLQVFTLASPYYIQLVIDDVVLTGDSNLLSVLAVGFFLVLIFAKRAQVSQSCIASLYPQD